MKRAVTRQFQRGDRDANESQITAVLKAANESYRLLPTGFGADILVLDTPMYFVEVKNGAKATLTEVERMLQEYCGLEGIHYYIIRTPDEAVDMLNHRRMLASGRATP